MSSTRSPVSGEAYHALANTAPDAIVMVDEDNVILSANPATERIFGYTRGEMVGQNMTLLIPERLRALHSSGMERYVATGEKHIPWCGVQLPGLRKDGTEVPLEVSFGEFFDGDRHVFTGFMRDISERVQHQRALGETAGELEAAVRELEARSHQAEEAGRAKSDFLATMSHELRTPLNATTGYADLLLAGIPEPIPEAAQKQVERIRLASKHLLSVIEEMLTFSRLEAGRETVNRAEVSLAELVDEVCAVIEPLAEDKQLRFHGPGGSIPSIALHTDPGKLRQILVNLLGNAVKFTNQGEVAFDIRLDGEDALFIVRDTGIGVGPENLQAIWEPFKQLEDTNTRSAGGTGLGLPVSRDLARLLGGDIAVESTPGRGSTFTLRLPQRTYDNQAV